MLFSGRGVLLDIEGTTSSISFVYDVMFPFVRRELEAHLRDHWGGDDLRQACELIAVDAGHVDWSSWSGDREADEQQTLVAAEVIRQMDGDIKATGLKQLQGLIWKSGFESGELQAHLYDDVAPAVRHWKEMGLDVWIYSSGSVQAQKLFFGHTIAGDLLSLFGGHYDTKTGPKKEADSYRDIAADIGAPTNSILFLSDVAAELDAAKAAGMTTALCMRPGNAPPPDALDHPRIKSFAEIVVARRP